MYGGRLQECGKFSPLHTASQSKIGVLQISEISGANKQKNSLRGWQPPAEHGCHPRREFFVRFASSKFHSKPQILHKLNIICAKNTGINIDFTIC